MELSMVIKELEMKLLDGRIRSNPDRISELLSSDFVEHCSSGEVYSYKSGDSFGPKASHDQEYILNDFNVSLLSETVVLATYQLIIQLPKEKLKSLRSSVWVYNDGMWKMKFHQGTNCNKYKREISEK